MVSTVRDRYHQDWDCHRMVCRTSVDTLYAIITARVPIHIVSIIENLRLTTFLLDGVLVTLISVEIARLGLTPSEQSYAELRNQTYW